MSARQFSGKKPKNLYHTLRALFSYLGRHRLMLFAVAVLVAVSAAANLLGNYMIRPIVNNLTSGETAKLVSGVVITAAIYLTGVIAAYGYTQIMV